MLLRQPGSTLFPYTTLFRSGRRRRCAASPAMLSAWPASRADAARQARRELIAIAVEQIHRLDHFAGAAIRVARDTVIEDRKSTRLNSSHTVISYAVFCLKKK